MEYKLQVNFDLDYVGDKNTTVQDILDAIIEDSQEAIQKVINNIVDGGQVHNCKIKKARKT